jgi:hypothetical protein
LKKITVAALLLYFCLITRLMASHHGEGGSGSSGTSGASGSSSYGNTPVAEKGLEPEGTVRVFLKQDHFDHLLEMRVRNQSGGRFFQSARLGTVTSVYQPNDSFLLKMGAYYQLQMGVWHDEDWDKGTDGIWRWWNTNKRLEHLALVDFRPRVKLGETWVAESRVRLQYNITSTHRTIKIRPGVTHFWTKNDKPFINFFGQVELYLPLNYNKPYSLYEIWGYLGALYHMKKWFGFGTHVAYRKTVWRRDEEFKQSHSDKTFTASDTGYVLGLDFIVKLEI